MMILENDAIRVEVSGDSGVITGLLNKALDAELIAFPENSESWRLSVPYEGDTGFVLSPRTSPLLLPYTRETGNFCSRGTAFASGVKTRIEEATRHDNVREVVVPPESIVVLEALRR